MNKGRCPSIALAYITGVLSLASWTDDGAQPVFSSPRAFPAGNGAFIPAAADLNGDGNIDLAVPNKEGDAVSVLFGDGRGGFSAPAVHAVGRSPRSAAIADLDGDGAPDLVIANRASGDLTLLFGDGKGGFPRSAELPVERGPQAVAIADLNGDGAPDLAVAGRESRRILVYMNDGEGRFSGPTALIVGKGPRSVIAADLNGDGAPDLATVNRLEGTVTIRFGDGKGNFTGSHTLAAGAGPTMLVDADVDADGHTDLVVADRILSDLVFGDEAPGMQEKGRIYVFRGDGTGRFAEPAAWDAGGHPAGIAVADLNGDGVPDIAVANNAPDNLVVLFGAQDGGYSDPVVVSTDAGQTPRAVIAVDLNHDERYDLIVSSRDSNRIFVWINQTAH